MRFEHFKKGEIAEAMSDSKDGRTWLLGSENADDVFSGYWTRRRSGDIETQVWRWHDAGEVESIIAGQLHLQIADESGRVTDDVILKEGDLFYIGKNVRHRADAVGEELCVGLLFCPKPYPIAEGQPSWSD